MLGATACRQCDPGTVQKETAGTKCVSSPSGTIVNNGGSSWSAVAKGWHSTQCDIEKKICLDSEPCRRGTIGNVPPTDACMLCPAGWTSYRGSVDCQMCQAGKYSNEAGMKECVACGEYEIQPRIGAKECVACLTFQRGDSARTTCIEGRTPTPSMLPPSRPVAIVATKSTVTYHWNSLVTGDDKDDDEYTPVEIVVEWCSDDLFKEGAVNTTVISAAASTVTLPSQNNGAIPPTRAGLFVRLTTRNDRYRSKSYSPISALWMTSNRCQNSFLNDVDVNLPWSWNCTQCPDGSSCAGNDVTRSRITANTGWWRLSTLQESPDYIRFTPCLAPTACIGVEWNDVANGSKIERCNTENGFRQWCNRTSLSKDGERTSVSERCRLCGTCQEQFQHPFGRVDCEPCPAKGDSFVQYILLFFTLCIFFSLFTLLVYCRAKGRGRKSVSSGIRKIIINFLQVSSLCVAWSVPWPASITWMLVVEGFSSSLSDSTISLSCSMHRSTAFQVMQTSQIMWCLAPFVMIIGMTVVYGFGVTTCCPEKCGNGTKRTAGMAKCELWRKRKQSFQSPKDNWVMACFYTFYLMYPVLSASSFSLLRCIEIDGVAYLRGDLQVECYSWTDAGHMWWVACLSLPCLFLFVLGIPLGGLVTLWLHRDRLYNRSHRKHRWAMVRYGLLYDGYREGAWWFEVVVAMRKAGFVAMAMLTEGRLQVQIAVGFLALMIAMNILIQPYGLGIGAAAAAAAAGVAAETRPRKRLALGLGIAVPQPAVAGLTPIATTNQERDEQMTSFAVPVGHNASDTTKGASEAFQTERKETNERTERTERSRPSSVPDRERSRSSVASWQSSMLLDETPEERETRMRHDKYDHRILHRMDLVALLTSLVLAWSGMLFILAEDDRLKRFRHVVGTKLATETKHSASEEILGTIVVMFNLGLLCWAGYAFVSRFINEHDAHVKLLVQQAKKLRFSAISGSTFSYTNKMLDRKKKTAANKDESSGQGMKKRMEDTDYWSVEVEMTKNPLPVSSRKQHKREESLNALKNFTIQQQRKNEKELKKQYLQNMKVQRREKMKGNADEKKLAEQIWRDEESGELYAFDARTSVSRWLIEVDPELAGQLIEKEEGFVVAFDETNQRHYHCQLETGDAWSIETDEE